MKVVEIVSIASGIGTTLSVGLLALQTRAVASQTRISNALAGASVLIDSGNSLRNVYAILVERPELRDYLYNKKVAPSRGKPRSRVISVVETLADALEEGLVVHRIVPASESYSDWASYSRFMLEHSPTLRVLATEHPDWWPQLSKIDTSSQRDDLNV